MNRERRQPVRKLVSQHKRDLQSSGPRPLFSTLESRMLLSGAVTATVGHGRLHIQGDASANLVALSQAGLSRGQLRVSGTGGTTINGEDSVIMSGISRGVLIELAGGADNLKIRDTHVTGDLTVGDTDGANTLATNNLQVDENLRVTNGGSRSTTRISNATVGDDLDIRAGSHGQKVALQAVTVGGNTEIDSRGSGTVGITVDDSTFRDSVNIGTGRGEDVVQIDARGPAQGVPTVFADVLSVYLNAGEDLLQMGVPEEAGNRSVFLNRTVSHVTDGFMGMNPITHRAEYAARVDLNGGRGDDTLQDFNASTYAGPGRFHVQKFENFTTSVKADTTAPTVSSTAPVTNAIGVALNKKFAAIFSEVMDESTINGSNITVTSRGAGGRQMPVAGVVTYVGTTVTFAATGGFSPTTSYTVSISTGVKDVAGNTLAANYVSYFRTSATPETVAPTVSSVDPANASTGVALNKKIAATFSEVMDPTTIDDGTLTLTRRASRGRQIAVDGTVTYVGTTATFTPTLPLSAGTNYTATVRRGAKDLAGNSLASDFVWSFATGAVADTTAPTLVSNDPTDDETGVALNKKIAATFSEAMDPLTISFASVLVTGPGGTPVAGAVTYAGTTMTFTPTAILAPNAVYTSTITTGAKDLAGNALANDTSWSFTTGAAPDVLAPTVTATNPTDLRTNVARNKTVSATFSESMDVSTLTTTTYTLEGPGGVDVTGTVTYDTLSHIVSFVPQSLLNASTTYTATIRGGVDGAKDLAGNAMLTDKVWSFTTGTQIAQDTIVLGAAGAFAVMATSDISSSGGTVINGDVGLSPGTSQGIPPAQVNGTIHINDSAVLAAQASLLAAYNDAVSRNVSPGVLPGNMGGLTFTPGLYKNSTSVLISGVGAANNVTLDAQGDPNAIFIFQMGTTLTTGPSTQVILAGGAKASNIFWQVGSSATLNTASVFKGNILASITITVNTGSIVEGRLLGGSTTDGSVTIDASTITLPIA